MRIGPAVGHFVLTLLVPRLVTFRAEFLRTAIDCANEMTFMSGFVFTEIGKLACHADFSCVMT